MFHEVLKEAGLTALVLFSIPISYILFCLLRGVLDDTMKFINRIRKLIQARKGVRK